MAGHSKGDGQKPTGLYVPSQQIQSPARAGRPDVVRPERLQMELQAISNASQQLRAQLAELTAGFTALYGELYTHTHTISDVDGLQDALDAAGGGLWTSVADYGVVGDGVVDDTANLQTALNSENWLYIPDDFVCAVTSALSIPSGVTVGGRGTIKAASSFLVTSPAILRLNGNNITIQGITLDLTALTTTNAIRGIGRQATTLSRIAISGVTVDSPRYTGIDIVSDYMTSGTQQHEDIIIQNCRVLNCGADGIVLASTNRFLVLNNHVNRTGRTGIAMWGRNTNGTIQGNYVYRGTNPSFLFFGTAQGGLLRLNPHCSDIVVDSNQLMDNMSSGEDGIVVGEDGVTEFGKHIISNNIVYRAGQFGIDVQSNFTVVGNTVEEAKEVGIFIGRDLGGPVRNSVVSGNNVINTGNSLSGGAPVGIGFFSNQGNLNEFKNILVDGNLVADQRATQYTQYGIRVYREDASFANCTLSNNNLVDVTTEGINIYGTGQLVTNAFRWSGNQQRNNIKTVTSDGFSVFGYDTVFINPTSTLVVFNIYESFVGHKIHIMSSRGDTFLATGGNLFPPSGANLTLTVWAYYLLVRMTSNWHVEKG
jgi:parallel beta-helix repeat protein